MLFSSSLWNNGSRQYHFAELNAFSEMQSQLPFMQLTVVLLVCHRTTTAFFFFCSDLRCINSKYTESLVRVLRSVLITCKLRCHS